MRPLLFTALLLSSSAAAQASEAGWNEDEAALTRDPEPPPPPAPPPPETPAEKLLAAALVFDLELRSGIGWGSLSQDVFEEDEDALFGKSGKTYALADLTVGGVELSLALGTFLSDHWKLGYELSLGLSAALSSRNLWRPVRTVAPEEPAPSVPSRQALRQAASYVLPIGGYLAFYPSFSQSGGFSIAVHLGAGLFWGADSMGPGPLPTAATVAADIGYDLVWSDQLVWGVRARCGQTALHRADEAGNRATSLAATELGLALHLSAF
jgi:hypothetical protein